MSMTDLHVTTNGGTLAAEDEPGGVAGVLGNIIGGFITWGSDHLPGGILGVLGVFAAIGLLATQSGNAKRGPKARAVPGGRREHEATNAAIEAFFGALFRFIGHFLTGRPLVGNKTNDAGWFRPAHRTIADVGDVPVAQLGSVGLADAGPTLHERAMDGMANWPTWTRVPLTFVWKAARGVSLSLATVGRLTRSWARWPRLARVLVYLAVPGLPLAWWLDAGNTRALLVLTGGVLLAGGLLAAVTGPHGLALWHGVEPGDDDRYAPALWVNLHIHLRLPEGTYQQQWVDFPRDLSADDAAITVRLPSEFVGTEMDRTALDALLDARVPGQWVSRWHLYGDRHHVTWTRKPPPKPKPEPPDDVPFLDPRIQAAIEAAGPGEIVLGLDTFSRVVVRKLGDETPHWGLSVASGGGKSNTLLLIATQIARWRGTLVVIDVKRISMKAIEGVKGVHHYADPNNIGDMRKAISWVREEVKARQYTVTQEPGKTFDPLVLFIEEGNEFGLESGRWWKANKPSGAPETDPMWQDLASIAFVGREVGVHLIVVFQNFRDDASGRIGLRGYIPLIMMGGFNKDQWKNVTGSNAAPDAPKKAGRVALYEEGEVTWAQIAGLAKADRHLYRKYMNEMRELFGYDDGGLFGKPPAHSEVEVPELVRRASRDAGAKAASGASGEETAGGAVTSGERDSERHSGRDRLHLVKGDDAAQAPAEELLTLAEIGRRLVEKGQNVTPELLRQHKRRYAEFPKPRMVEGKEKYAESVIVEFYERRKKGA